MRRIVSLLTLAYSAAAPIEISRWGLPVGEVSLRRSVFLPMRWWRFSSGRGSLSKPVTIRAPDRRGISCDRRSHAPTSRSGSEGVPVRTVVSMLSDAGGSPPSNRTPPTGSTPSTAPASPKISTSTPPPVRKPPSGTCIGDRGHRRDARRADRRLGAYFRTDPHHGKDHAVMTRCWRWPGKPARGASTAATPTTNGGVPTTCVKPAPSSSDHHRGRRAGRRNSRRFIQYGEVARDPAAIGATSSGVETIGSRRRRW